VSTLDGEVTHRPGDRHRRTLTLHARHFMAGSLRASALAVNDPTVRERLVVVFRFGGCG